MEIESSYWQGPRTTHALLPEQENPWTKPKAAGRTDWTDGALLLIAAVGALGLTVAILDASAFVILFLPIAFIGSSTAILFSHQRDWHSSPWDAGRSSLVIYRGNRAPRRLGTQGLPMSTVSFRR